MSGWGGFTRTKHTFSPSRLSECGDLRTSRTLSYNDKPQPLRGAGVGEAWKKGDRRTSHGLDREVPHNQMPRLKIPQTHIYQGNKEGCGKMSQCSQAQWPTLRKQPPEKYKG